MGSFPSIILLSHHVYHTYFVQFHKTSDISCFTPCQYDSFLRPCTLKFGLCVLRDRCKSLPSTGNALGTDAYALHSH